MYVAMHFAAAAQVLLLVRVQGAGVRDQLLCNGVCGINLSKNSESLHCIQNQEPEEFKTIAEAGKTDP